MNDPWSADTRIEAQTERSKQMNAIYADKCISWYYFYAIYNLKCQKLIKIVDINKI